MFSFENARNELRTFKGSGYSFGYGALEEIGKIAAQHGQRAVLVHDRFQGSAEYVAALRKRLVGSELTVLGEIEGPGINAPADDVNRISDYFSRSGPDVVVSFGGGSTIDSVKAAVVLRTLGGQVDDYFGTNRVTSALLAAGKRLTPHVAVQTASSSASHLTRYSNITDIRTWQKKLIVDDAVVPSGAVFDYAVTLGAPPSLTVDGALDGMAHCLEVLYGSVAQISYPNVERVANQGISLVIRYLPQVMEDLGFAEGREALALATDLGGYCIMLGGTNGAHLTSFSLVDILSHGRACAILNPYYTVLFSRAIQGPLKVVGSLFRDHGYTDENIDRLQGRDLALAVADAMLRFYEAVGVPTKLDEVDGFSEGHIERALAAAKDPQLKMKLENMPVPMSPEMVDEDMGSVLRAAQSGVLEIVKRDR